MLVLMTPPVAAPLPPYVAPSVPVVTSVEIVQDVNVPISFPAPSSPLVIPPSLETINKETNEVEIVDIEQQVEHEPEAEASGSSEPSSCNNEDTLIMDSAPLIEKAIVDVAAQNSELESLIYTIAQLFELEPESCPIPASVVGTIVALSSPSSSKGESPKQSKSRRSESSRGPGRSSAQECGRDRNRRDRGRGSRGQARSTEMTPLVETCVPLNINEETRWKPSHAKSRLDQPEETDALSLKEAKAILNKLSIEKFEKLSDLLIDVAVRNEVVLSGVIDQVIKKAQMEWHFTSMYAELCCKIAHTSMPAIANSEDDLVVEDTHKLFRKLLLTRCQKEFEVVPSKEGWEAFSEEERQEKELLLKRATLGHIRFIGELYKQQMLSSRIMHECIQRLFGNLNNPDEESLECLCKLLSTIGEKLESFVKDQAEMVLVQQYYTLIRQLSSDATRLCTRVRFMLQDLLELRKNRWVARRKESKAMTIAQVHAEAAREAKEKSKQSGGNPPRLQRSQSLMTSGSSNHSHRNYGGSGSASAAWKARSAVTTSSATRREGDGWEMVSGTRPKLLKSRSTSDRFSMTSSRPPINTSGRALVGGSTFGVLRNIITSPTAGDRPRSSSNGASSMRRAASTTSIELKTSKLTDDRAGAQEISPEFLKKRVTTILEEFAEVGDLEDALQYIVDMNVDED